MLRNYISVFARSLVRHRGYSFINVVGLSLGLCSFILISLFLAGQTGFDSFHDGSTRLYRINKVVTTPDGHTERHALTPGLLAPALFDTFSEIESVSRVLPWFDDMLLSFESEAVITPDVAIVDSNFFDVFGFELLRGDSNRVLDAPLSIVLTQSVAVRLFGDSDPVGKHVTGLNGLEYVVTGVAADPRPDSHLRFSALISWSSTIPGGGNLDFAWLNRWITQAPFTYVKLVQQSQKESFEGSLPNFYATNDPDRASRYELYLQPIQQTYLESTDLMYAGTTNRGSAQNVKTYSVLRFLILLIAGINFVNLFTARGSYRFKEVGVRKVLGARRTQLIRQFVTESVFYCLLALLVAIILAVVLIPFLQSYTGVLARTIGSAGVEIFIQVVVLALVLGIASGIQPALMMSRARPAVQLNAIRVGRRAVMSRNFFVITQFVISMILVAGTLIVIRQLKFVSSTDMGFDQNQLIVLQTEQTSIQDRFEAFSGEVKRHPSIDHVAGSNAIPGSSTMTTSVLPDGVTGDVTYIANIVRIDDYSLLDTYEFELVEGRYFDPNRPTDATNGIVINESMMRMLGWQDAVGRRLDISGELSGGEVLGVVKDFNFQSLHQSIDPLAFYFAPRGDFLSVRFSGNSAPAVIDHLESTWHAFEPSYPFSYSFVDESFAEFYNVERRLIILLSLFAGLAVFIACLGLYGLAAHLAEVRTKEIGVRKVLGAGVTQIVFLFIRDLAVLVIAAIVIGVPIVALLSNEWLNNFAYRVSVGVDLYLLAGILVVLTALISTVHQPVRAALSNPVDALRDH